LTEKSSKKEWTDEITELPLVANPIKLDRAKKEQNDKIKQEKVLDLKEKGSDDEAIDPEERLLIKPSMKEFEKRKRKLMQHQKIANDKLKKNFDEEIDDKKEKLGIELVPQMKFEDYDFDAMAEMRALAQKMLRKKDREEIINDSYNRYSTPVDEDAPDWFLEDERKHSYKTMPITKEEYRAEKEKLMAILHRQPKKILEAKIRKKYQQKKKLKKADVKAKEILDQEGVDEASKMRQVQSLYKKAMAEAKVEKKYIVGKRFSASKNADRKVGRNTRLVDRRLKKDKKSEKKSRKKSRSKK